MAITRDDVKDILDNMVFKFHRVEGTNCTACWACMPDGTIIAYGESIASMNAEFNAMLGEKYAKEKAIQNATDKVYEHMALSLRFEDVNSIRHQDFMSIKEVASLITDAYFKTLVRAESSETETYLISTGERFVIPEGHSTKEALAGFKLEWCNALVDSGKLEILKDSVNTNAVIETLASDRVDHLLKGGVFTHNEEDDTMTLSVEGIKCSRDCYAIESVIKDHLTEDARAVLLPKEINKGLRNRDLIILHGTSNVVIEQGTHSLEGSVTLLGHTTPIFKGIRGFTNTGIRAEVWNLLEGLDGTLGGHHG